MKTIRLACCVLAVWVLGRALAEEGLVPVRQKSILAAPLIDAAPKIDGVLDDAAWAKAQALRGWAFKGKPVAHQTVGWICRDQSNFYFAARCFEDNLGGLVTKFEGRALWKNDCIELFIVPEKKERFFAHLTISCDGRAQGTTWVPDEWGEATRGKDLKLTVATGREKDAWTMELAVPIVAFGHPITPASVWALGFNRERHVEPEEVSSFLGGFNRPREYPDLVFDGRSVVVDGLGIRNIGTKKEKVIAVVTAGNARGEFTRTLLPGQGSPVSWGSLFHAGLIEGFEFEIAVQREGETLFRERYVLAPAVKKEEPIDLAKIPPPKFAKTVLDDPDFFPISVWLQPAGPAANYKKMGVNVYVGGVDSYPRPKDKEFLDAIQKQGMYAICPYKKQYVDEKLYEHPAFIGWMFGDEPDNVNTETGQVNHTPADLLAATARMRRDDPAHPIYLNLGCGVADERFVGRGATDEQYAEYPKACDIISYDIYPCNSVSPDGPDRLYLVARGIDRLRKWAGPEKRVWFWLEANKISKGEGRAPTPDEVKTMIWMVLVHGANGYGFFCHSWAGKQPSVAAIEPEMQAALAPVNAEVRSLARVLNSPAVADGATVKNTMGSRVDVLVKNHDGAAYVFAVNMLRKPEKPTITLRGVGDGTAEVLFENRTLPVQGGQLTDDFAPYAVHRYRIGK